MSQPLTRELHIDGRPSGLHVRTALRWWSRAVGLLATPRLDDPCGLWIAPCNCVHTFGMRYAIDAVFVDAGGRVAKVALRLRPWRAAGCRRAVCVLELRAGLAAALGIVPGTTLRLR